MIYFIGTIHVIICVFLILVVLLQQGKGADLSVFGGGSTMTAFGARGAATVLHKLTVVSFVLFILTTMGMAILRQTGDEGGSVMTGAAPAPVSAPATPAETAPAPAAPAAPAEAPAPQQ